MLKIKPARHHVPLLCILWPLIAAIVLARAWSTTPWAWVGLGAVVTLALGLWMRLQAKSILFTLARPLLYVGIFGLAFGYVLFREGPLPQAEAMPAREAFLTVKIDRVFGSNTQDNLYLRAIGLVTKAPIHLQELVGEKLAFSVKFPNETKPLKGSIGEIKGVLSTTLSDDANAFQHYLAQSGVYYELRRGEWLKTLENPPKSERFLSKSSNYLEFILRENSIQPEWSDIYIAILLGKTAVLSPQQKTAFAQTGTMHLFAISGLHVAVISGLIFFFLKRLPLPGWAIALLGLSILLLYVEITGGAPSARRAFWMVAFMWGGLALHRQATAFAGLVAAATLSLLWEPALLFNAGFQLSYTVVAALLLYGLPLSRILKTRFALWRDLPIKSQKAWHKSTAWLQAKAIEGIAFSFSATWMSTPLIISYFKILAPVSLFINLPLIPLGCGVIVLGFISLFSGLCKILIISSLINPIAEMILGSMAYMVEFSRELPLAHLESHWRYGAEGPCFVILSLIILIYGPTPTLKNPKPLIWAPVLLVLSILGFASL